MIGIGFIDDLISDIGLPLVKKGVKSVLGIDLDEKTLTPEDKQKLLDSQIEIMMFTLAPTLLLQNNTKRHLQECSSLCYYFLEYLI